MCMYLLLYFFYVIDCNSKMWVDSFFDLCVCRRNLNYFSSAYTAAVSAVDPDAGHGELVIKVPSELWKQGDGRALGRHAQLHLMVYLIIYNAKHCVIMVTVFLQ